MAGQRNTFFDALHAGGRCTRRALLRRGLMGLGVGAVLPSFLQNAAWALAQDEAAAGDAMGQRILVVVELNGGNDGLNTVVPYADDAYYRARPTIAIAPHDVRKLSTTAGLHPQLTGCEQFFKNGQMAIVEGCGYARPSLSHHASLEYWHTGTPYASESRGWLGRLADANWSPACESVLTNVGPAEKRAVQAAQHRAVVFHDPQRYVRSAAPHRPPFASELNREGPTKNASLAFLRDVADTAARSSEWVQSACAEFRSQTNYGAGNLRNDLRRVAALIAAEFPSRIYYVSMSGWDTHARQLSAHDVHLGYLDDALKGFLTDVTTMGRGADVAVMTFTEFGRRVAENTSAGTDHGTAGPMLVLGGKVRGGLYGQSPSLTDLDDGNLKMTTDFRRVYATVIQEWMGYNQPQAILKGDYPTLGMFV